MAAASDLDEMRACLADDLVFDAGMQTIIGGDACKEFVASTESPWKEVNLLGSHFDMDQAALFYEGADKDTGVKPGLPNTLRLGTNGSRRSRR